MIRALALCLLGIALAAFVFADNPVTPSVPIPAATFWNEANVFVSPDDNSRDSDRALDQGGERCETATPILSIPYCDRGTTAGFNNDYIPPCNDASQAPDVVYRYVPPQTQVVSISLCGSSFNTVLHIWRGCPGQGGVLICCNDNFCGLQSCCTGITLLTGQPHFIIVDGAGVEAGSYSLHIEFGQQCPQPCPDSCIVQCPPNSIPEGEPCPNIPDNFNGGCNVPNPMFSPIQCGQTICGTATVTAGAGRDTDWYLFNLSFRDSIIWCVRAEFNAEVMIQQPGPGGCADRDTIARAVGLPCSLTCVSACLEPGQYALYIAPVGPPIPCSDYVANLQCLPCTTPGDTCPYRSEDVEPNNNLCANQNPTISCPDTLCGNLSGTDGDYYEFRIPTGACGRVIIDVFGDDTPGWFPFGMGLDPGICLYTANCGATIACDDNSGAGEDPRLVSPCLPSGLYELRVGSQAGTSGPYILALSCQTCQCPESCHVVCNGEPEGEPCPNFPDNFNSGCNSAVPSFRIISCPTTICGTAFAMDGVRDTDWYRVRIMEPDTIWWCVTAEFAVDVAMFAAGPGMNACIDLDTLDCARGDSCETVCVGACVQPGVYFFYVAPTFLGGVFCRDYRATLLCTICGPNVCEAPDSVVIHYPTVANNNIHLYWPPVPGADEYRIYRADVPDAPPAPITYLATTTDTFFVDTGVIGTAAIKNFYQVVAHCPAPGCGP